MSEFYYYGTTMVDNIEIIEHILTNTNLYLIPDIWYRSESHLIFARSMNNNIQSLINQTNKFHLWNEMFYPKFPLRFFSDDTEEYVRLFTGNSEGYKGMLYFHASPSLILSLPRFIVNKEGQCLRIFAGCLYHTRDLYDEDNHAVIPIPQSVKDEYKKVVKIMKEKLTKLKKTNIWIGKQALDLFEKNELELYDGAGWIKNC